MAFQAKDGKSFGNRQQMKAYDERPPKKDAKAMPDEQDETGGEGNTPEDIHEMVAQHGPAEKVEISHSEGKHTKVSHHGSATHKSEHASAKEAHQHGMIAAGVEPGEQDEQEPAQSAAGTGAVQQAGGIPGM
jgi:hypothetical protein